MAYLSGPRRGVGRIKLHDPPPGYSPPPELGIPLKDQQRKLRRDWTLIQVATVVLVLAAAAFIVLIIVFVASHL